jgi:hypothetical protein
MNETPSQPKKRTFLGVNWPLSRGFRFALWALLLVHLALGFETFRRNGGMSDLRSTVDHFRQRFYHLAAQFGYRHSAATRPLEDVRVIYEPIDRPSAPPTPEPK